MNLSAFDTSKVGLAHKYFFDFIWLNVMFGIQLFYDIR